MTDERFTKNPARSGSQMVTTGVPPPPPAVGAPGDPPPWPGRRTLARLCLRLVGAAAAAAAFVFLCWLMGGSAYPGPRMLSGPLWGLKAPFNWSPDSEIAIKMMAVLLPCIFAVGVWRNAATVALSILACLAWVAIGFWIEAMASI